MLAYLSSVEKGFDDICNSYKEKKRQVNIVGWEQNMSFTFAVECNFFAFFTVKILTMCDCLIARYFK